MTKAKRLNELKRLKRLKIQFFIKFRKMKKEEQLLNSNFERTIK